MSTTTTFPFDTAGNYTFDAAKIDITGGAAVLKLTSNPSQTFAQNMNDDVGFTYSAASRADVVGGVLAATDQRPANAVLCNTFLSSTTADWGVGTLTATVTGGASVSGGNLVCTGGTDKGIKYDGDNLADMAQVGTVHTHYTPNYSGTPVDDRIIWSMGPTSGANSKMTFWHSYSGGHLRLICQSDTGATLFNNVFISGWNPTAGTSYEFEVDYDLTAGATRVFLDGVQQGSTTTTTGTRAQADLQQISLGRYGNASVSTADQSYAHVAVYKTVQHTSNFTATVELWRYYYRESYVTLPGMTYSGPGTIQAYTAFSATEVGTPKYTINGKYWNGSAWATSDYTYAQSSDAATINTNIGSLTAASPTVVTVAFTSNNTVQSTDAVTVTYTGQLYNSTDPTIVPNTLMEINSLTAFTASTTVSGNSLVKYVLTIDGTDKYWNGSAWATSTGYAQSNTAAEINTNCGSFSWDRNDTYLKCYLHSDGATQASLNEASLTYLAALSDPTLPTRVYVEGFIYDNDGPVSGCVVQVRPYSAGFINSTIFHQYKWMTVDTTNADGYFYGYIYKSPAGKYWELKIGDQRYKTEIPDQTSVDLKDLTLTAL